MDKLTTRFRKYTTYCLILLVVGCTAVETEFILPTPLALDATEVEFTSFTANWESPIGVDTYILEVAEDQDFNRMIAGFPVQISRATSREITGLNDGSEYFYRLTGILNGSNTQLSNTIRLQTKSFQGNAPQSVRVIENGSTKFSVEWDAVTDAEGYIINLALDEDFTRPVSSYFQTDLGLENSIELVQLSPDQTYYFRVQSYKTNSSGIGQILSDQSETLINTTLLPEAPEVLPAANVSPLKFTATWKSVEDADLYLLEIAEDRLFTTIVAGYNQIEVLDTFRLVTGNLDYRKNYYYRVRTKLEDKLSDYSEVQLVESSLSSNCLLSQVYFHPTVPSIFTYDAQNRLIGLEVSTRYLTSWLHGRTAKYTFEYENSTSRLIKTATGVNGTTGDLVDKFQFFYNADGTLDSAYIERERYSVDFQRKYTYNSNGQLIKMREVFANPSTPSTQSRFIEHDYTYDTEGNITNMSGFEFYWSHTENKLKSREPNWDFRYDDKINPLMLLPQAVYSLIPFTFNQSTTDPIDYIPFAPSRNITFWKLQESTFQTEWTAVYDYNQNDLIDKQTGFFQIRYEYTNCD